MLPQVLRNPLIAVSGLLLMFSFVVMALDLNSISLAIMLAAGVCAIAALVKYYHTDKEYVRSDRVALLGSTFIVVGFLLILLLPPPMLRLLGLLAGIFFVITGLYTFIALFSSHTRMRANWHREAQRYVEPSFQRLADLQNIIGLLLCFSVGGLLLSRQLADSTGAEFLEVVTSLGALLYFGISFVLRRHRAPETDKK